MVLITYICIGAFLKDNMETYILVAEILGVIGIAVSLSMSLFLLYDLFGFTKNEKDCGSVKIDV